MCSRREADKLIKCGKVELNGKIVTEYGVDVGTNDIVKINGKAICENSSKVYILLNKPQGYVTTSKEQFNRPCVIDLIKEDTRIFPVGRLDMYSEGMLILTNDGEFMNKVIHPRKHIPKTYRVIANDVLTSEQMENLENGVDIGGYITKKAQIKNVVNNTFDITIYEGKNRQIRKMCEAIGLKVVALKRIKIGDLELGNLKSGKYRYLDASDLDKILQIN